MRCVPQELLIHLLDGLHNDCNRVRKKPSKVEVEGDGKSPATEAGISAEAWRRHLLDNQSFIVDAFCGQEKSCLECPDCGEVSITFDPFMCLSGALAGGHHKCCCAVRSPSTPPSTHEPRGGWHSVGGEGGVPGIAGVFVLH